MLPGELRQAYLAVRCFRGSAGVNDYDGIAEAYSAGNEASLVNFQPGSSARKSQRLANAQAAG
jgi:hypothetical protein